MATVWYDDKYMHLANSVALMTYNGQNGLNPSFHSTVATESSLPLNVSFATTAAKEGGFVESNTGMLQETNHEFAIVGIAKE